MRTGGVDGVGGRGATNILTEHGFIQGLATDRGGHTGDRVLDGGDGVDGEAEGGVSECGGVGDAERGT